MPRVRLLHWDAGEAAKSVKCLAEAKYQVEYEEHFQPALMRAWRESPPDAFVIDLSKLPSHGKEIAIALRQSPATRYVPIVFCEGDEIKVNKIRALLPDAVYCSLSKLPSALRKALTNRPSKPVKPVAMMDRYASRTAAQKLGIKNSSRVAVVDPPRDYAKVLGEMPPGVEISDDTETGAHVTLCFTHDAASLQRMLSSYRSRAGATKLWILWRKGGSAAYGGVNERLVRESAIHLGLVDYKVCSVNEVWSALLFAPKRAQPRC